jgi:hypothetical protein
MNATKTLDASWTYKDITQGAFSELPIVEVAMPLVYLPIDNATAIKVTLTSVVLKETYCGFNNDNRLDILALEDR